MDLKKRLECAEILKLSHEECAKLLSQKLFKDQRNIKMIARAFLFGKFNVDNMTRHLYDILSEIIEYKPILKLICKPYTPFKYPLSYYKSHPYITEQRKRKGPQFRSSIPSWSIFIKLFNSEFALISLDHLTYIEMQCIQLFIQDDLFTVKNEKINYTEIIFGGFQYNEAFRENYDESIIITAIFDVLISIHKDSIEIIKDVIRSLASKYPKLFEIWKKYVFDK